MVADDRLADGGPPALAPANGYIARLLRVFRSQVHRGTEDPLGDHAEAPIVASVRFALAVSALLILWIDPPDSARLLPLTLTSLGVYCLYSAILVLLSLRSWWAVQKRIFHWVDVLFFVYLIALTEGTSSIFFFFFFFSIVAASFYCGFREGLLVTITSVCLFTIVGWRTAPSGADFELSRSLIRPVCLFVLGYLIAYWGGCEIRLQRRLRLLQDVSNVWNPRLGSDQIISLNLQRLLDFHGAKSCLLVLEKPTAPPVYLMYTLPGSAENPGVQEITRDTADELLRLPPERAALYREARHNLPWNRDALCLYHVGGGTWAAEPTGDCAVLANLTEAAAFMTAPYIQRDGTSGRIFLTADGDSFSRSDVLFLVQISRAIATVAENISLMEEVVTKAGEYTRASMARDIHDTTIQPYLGIKLALEGLQKESAHDARTAARIQEIIDMIGYTVRNLREYASAMRERRTTPGEFLIAAIKKYAEQFSRFYEIEIEVKGSVDTHLNGRLAAEVFQMVVEALSNVLKHTPSKKGYVLLNCEQHRLAIDVANEIGERDAGDFRPHSISDRINALDGEMSIARRNGYLVIQMGVPI